mmetsp:Transcript_50178/g.112971  ORF Transcript_50178/g.112971 Transcript_50178/m.112971 type:complete len:733 (-) Transcript_50178:96-2294(-)
MTTERYGRIIAEVKQELDTFLDPSLHELAKTEGGKCPRKEGNRSPGSTGSTSEDVSSMEMIGRLEAELLKQKAANNRLLVELEDLQHEHGRVMKEMENSRADDAAKAAQLLHERDQYERDGRSKRRRVSEVEGQLVLLTSERDILLQEKEDLLEEARATHAELADRLKATQEAAEAKVQSMWEDLCAERQRADEATTRASGVTDPAELVALRAQVEELQCELEAARIAAAQYEPDKTLAAELREQHLVYEEELKETRANTQELEALRAEVIILKQEDRRLRADLEVRNRVLKESEDLVRSATSARKDIEAYIQAVATILEDAAVLEAVEGSYSGRPSAASRPGSAVSTPSRLLAGAPEGHIDFEKLNRDFDERVEQLPTTQTSQEAASPPRGASRGGLPPKPSPTNLSLAWAKVQGITSSLRQQCGDLRRELQQAQAQERGTRAEIEQLRAAQAASSTRSEELQKDAELAKEDLTTAHARLAVLREAGKASNPDATADEREDSLQQQLALAQKREAVLNARVSTRDETLQQLREELSTERQKTQRLASVEDRAARLTQANSDLLASLVAQDVSKQQEERRRSHELELQQENSELQDEVRSLRKELSALGATPELSELQKQYERYKRATKRSVQDFREGIFKLLGWKVEMLGEGTTLEMHLTSRYLPGQVLKFQLQQSGATGVPPEFELLDTEWAKRLMSEDRQATFYLQTYDSVPGFLGHVTCDLVRKPPAG